MEFHTTRLDHPILGFKLHIVPVYICSCNNYSQKFHTGGYAEGKIPRLLHENNIAKA